jgi:eukaryotic-like serine/threonine-protein kinase
VTVETLDRLKDVLAGRYRIDRELAGGGMSRVFVAEELSLGRQVVIKLLRPELAEGLSAERFTREIRLAARLQHPNVVPVLAAGDADGLPYYTMPFVRGHSLRARLDNGRIDVRASTRFLGDVARALAYAHGERVVHRDIKPENVLLSGDAAVVADFGIAKAIDASRTGETGLTLTSLGSAIGTPAYMAPEQAAADPDVDHRADLYAWGLMAYECLTGAHPFAGRRTMHEMIKAQLVDIPPALDARTLEVPGAIGELVMQCLAKDPAARPAAAGELLEILDGALATRDRSAASVTYTPSAKPPAIAVLPFANMSADPEAEFFSDGMAEEILNALTKLSGVRVVARTSCFAFKGRNVDVREIGQQLGVGFILEGSVRKGGSKIRITAQLVDALTGHHLWSERYDRDMSDVFAVQDEITVAIRDALSERLLGIGQVAKQAPPAIDPATYELFLRGRHLVSRRSQGMLEGLAALQQVVERAPDYAPGHVGLAFGHAMLIWYAAEDARSGWPKVRAAAERAVSLDPTLGIAHVLLGSVALWFDWDWAAAKAHMDRGIALAPDDPDVFGHRCWAAIVTWDDAEAMRIAGRAAALDPLNPSLALNGVMMSYLCRRFDLAIALADRIIQIAPDFAEAHRWKALALAHLGRPEEALQAATLAVRLSGRHYWALLAYARALYGLGRSDELLSIEEEIEGHAGTSKVPAFVLASIATMTSSGRDAVFAALEQAYADRHFWLIVLHREATYDEFRSDPHFDDLLERIGLLKSPPAA